MSESEVRRVRAQIVDLDWNHVLWSGWVGVESGPDHVMLSGCADTEDGPLRPITLPARAKLEILDAMDMP